MPYTPKTVKLQTGGALYNFLEPSRREFDPTQYSEEEAAAIQSRLDQGYTLFDAKNNISENQRFRTLMVDPDLELSEDAEKMQIDTAVVGQELDKIKESTGADRLKWRRALQIIDQIQGKGFSIARDSGGRYWIENNEDGTRKYAANAILEVRELLDEFGDGKVVEDDDAEFIGDSDEANKTIEELVPEEYRGGFTKSDNWALAALGTDLATSVAGLGMKVTGVGAIAGAATSALGGIAATAMDAYSDWLDPEVGGWETLGNAGMRLGLEAAEAFTFMPASMIGKLSKGSKYGELLRKGIHYGMAAGFVDTAVGTEWNEIMDKVSSEGGVRNLEMDDLRKLGAMAQFAMGLGSSMHTKRQLKRALPKQNKAADISSTETKRSILGEVGDAGTKAPKSVAARTALASQSAPIVKKKADIASELKSTTRKTNKLVKDTQKSARTKALNAKKEADIDINPKSPTDNPVGPNNKPPTFKGRKPKSPVASPGKDNKGAPNINDGKEYVRPTVSTQKAAAKSKLTAKKDKITADRKAVEDKAKKTKADAKAKADKATKEIDNTVKEKATAAKKAKAKANKKTRRDAATKELKARKDKLKETEKAAETALGPTGKKMVKKSREKVLGKKGEADLNKKADTPKKTEVKNPEGKKLNAKIKKTYKAPEKKEGKIKKAGKAVKKVGSKAVKKVKEGPKAVRDVADRAVYKLAARDGYSSKHTIKALAGDLRAREFEGRQESRKSLEKMFSKMGYSDKEIKDTPTKTLRLARRAMVEKAKKIEKKQIGGVFTPWLSRVVSKWFAPSTPEYTPVEPYTAVQPISAQPNPSIQEHHSTPRLVPSNLGDVNIYGEGNTKKDVIQEVTGKAVNPSARLDDADNFAIPEILAKVDEEKEKDKNKAAEEGATPEQIAAIDAKYEQAKQALAGVDSSDPQWMSEISRILNFIKPSDFINSGEIFAEIPAREGYVAPIVQTLGVDNMPGFDYAVGQTKLIPRTDTADSFASHIMAKKFHEQGLRSRNELVAKNAAFVENRRQANIAATNEGQARAAQTLNRNIAEDNSYRAQYTKDMNMALAQRKAADDKKFNQLVNGVSGYLVDGHRRGVEANLAKQYNELASVHNTWNTEYRPRLDAYVKANQPEKVKELKTHFMKTSGYDPDDLNRQMLDIRSQYKGLY